MVTKKMTILTILRLRYLDYLEYDYACMLCVYENNFALE